MLIAPEAFDTLLAYSLVSQPPLDASAFRKLVGLNGRLGSLTAACFLLYRAPEQPAQPRPTTPLPPFAGVARFVRHTAPMLLQQLNRTTQAQRVTLHGRTRGKVDWSGTYKARYSEDSNPTVYVCLQSWRRFDRPENQLFVFLLKALSDCLQRVPAWLWGWRAWGSGLQEENEIKEQQPLLIGDFFAQLAHRLRIYRGHISLQEIPVPALINARHILAARTSKNELYAELADFYAFYQAVVGFPEWESWARVLTATLPMPESAAEIGEYLRMEARDPKDHRVGKAVSLS